MVKRFIACILVLVMAVSLGACGGPKEVTDVPLSMDFGGKSYDGLYTGMALKKIPEGEGTFS